MRQKKARMTMRVGISRICAQEAWLRVREGVRVSEVCESEDMIV